MYLVEGLLQMRFGFLEVSAMHLRRGESQQERHGAAVLVGQVLVYIHTLLPALRTTQTDAQMNTCEGGVYRAIVSLLTD